MIFPNEYEAQTVEGPVLDATEALVTAVHGPRAGALTRRLALDHPTPATVLTAVHVPTGEAASTLSLIPWKWRIDETEVTAWEVGIVATAEAHRNRGLSSTLMTEAERRMNEAGVPLGIIQGIPYYYRRFGYEHAFNLENHLELEFRQVPAAPGWTSRPATVADVGTLQAFDRVTSVYEVAAIRGPEVWRYRLEKAPGTETEMDHQLVIDPNGKVRGYLAVSPRGFGEGLVVHEAAGDEGVWSALAARAVELARAANKPYLRLNLGPSHPFAGWARDRGASDKGGWHWQVSVPDPGRLLAALAPTLERRATQGANRPWSLTLDGFRTTHHLAFVPGEGLTFPAQLESPTATVRIPPELWAKLTLGWKPVPRLREFYPDCHGWGDRALELLEVLFPVRQGFIQTLY